MKRLLSAVISLSIVAANVIGINLNSSVINAIAEDLTTNDEFSGSCGENVTWRFDEQTGVLTIEGKGPMYQNNYTNYTEWTYSKYSEQIKEVVFKDDITEIGCSAFGTMNNFSSNYPNLTKVTLPSTLKLIGKNAFRFIKIQEVSFPESLDEIDQEAFYGSGLKKVNLHSGITIYGFAFADCNSLNEVNIPDNIIYKIWYGNPPGPNSMFSGCKSLEKVIINGGGETIDRFGKSIFNALPESICINCTSLKTVIINGNVDYIGNSAFYNCPALTDIYFYNTDLSTITSKNDPNKYYIPIDTSNNPKFHIVEGSTTEQTLRNAGYLTNDNTWYLTDFTALDDAIENAEKLDSSKYTEDSFKAVTDALEKAKALKENIDATQEEVDAATEAITEAKNALVEKLGILNDAIANAEKLDSSKYTEDSFKAVTDALEKAMALKENIDATQEEINAAAKALNDAINALKLNNTTYKDSIIPPAVNVITTRDINQVNNDKKQAKKQMKQAKITKLTVKSKANKKIAVSWKKVKKAKGYEVQVAAKKNFKKSKIIFKKFTTKKKLTIKNKKIKSKKTYYVRVRAYATYLDTYGNEQKVYSSWNKKLRKVKVK